MVRERPYCVMSSLFSSDIHLQKGEEVCTCVLSLIYSFSWPLLAWSEGTFRCTKCTWESSLFCWDILSKGELPNCTKHTHILSVQCLYSLHAPASFRHSPNCRYEVHMCSSTPRSAEGEMNIWTHHMDGGQPGQHGGLHFSQTNKV